MTTKINIPQNMLLQGQKIKLVNALASMSRMCEISGILDVGMDDTIATVKIFEDVHFVLALRNDGTLSGANGVFTHWEDVR